MHLVNSLPLLILLPVCLTQPLEGRTESNGASSSLSKRADTIGWIGQFQADDCSESPDKDPKVWKGVTCANAEMNPKDYCIEGARPKLPADKCVPWYPVLTAENGPSMGVTFGAGSEKMKQIRFYKSLGPCLHDLSSSDEKYWGLPGCCDPRRGTFLGTIREDGTSDFGASYNMGLEHGMCAKIGSQPGANQTLWVARFVQGTQEMDIPP